MRTRPFPTWRILAVVVVTVLAWAFLVGMAVIVSDTLLKTLTLIVELAAISP
jgi:hypothetical protein